MSLNSIFIIKTPAGAGSIRKHCEIAQSEKPVPLVSGKQFSFLALGEVLLSYGLSSTHDWDLPLRL